MKLSISNIGWDAVNDNLVYALMNKYGYSGLEIAPTRIFTENPYDHIKDAAKWVKELQKRNGLVISSMQSIWYGRQEKIFGSSEERQFLIDYTKKAINFAQTIGCNNLVFGCPRNRNIPDGVDAVSGISFFKILGDYAAKYNTAIGMEANPPIYNTNFINNTISAFELVRQVNSDGFKLNLDVGTMIQNNENVEEIIGNVHLINHVHISEPGLKPIEHRKLHEKLMETLIQENYQGFISIEMGKCEGLVEIEQILKYVKEIFEE